MKPRREIHIARPELGEEEWQALRAPLERGWLTQGSEVAEFERAFAERHGVRHALAVNSATSGLHLALLALGVGPGDEVIVPSFTWVSSANAAVYCGATPVLADVDVASFNLTPEEVKRRLTPRTRAVMAVHLFGRCAEVDAIRALLPPGVAVVEDAACAAGAEADRRPAGGLGDLGVFSFHPRKAITTGEGGMVTTDDDHLADSVARLRSHGASVSEEQRHRGPRPWVLPEFADVGFNYRMTDLQGAVGRVQLAKLDRLVEERERWAAWYRKELSDLSWLSTPAPPESGRHAWQSFVARVDPESAPLSRNLLMERLGEAGIATRPGTHAVHRLTVYRDRLGHADDDFPASLDCDRNTVAIPLHNCMDDEDYAYVVETLHQLAR